MVKKKKSQASLRAMEGRVIDKMMGMVSIVGPVSASPQVVEIFTKQSAQGVSLLSWVMYLMLGVISLSYGLFHKLKPIVVSQILWTIMDLVVIAGILMYSRGVVPNLSFDALVLLNNLGKVLIIVSFACGAMAISFFMKARQLKQA